MGGEQTIGDITIFPCMDVCPCYAPQPNEKQYRPEIRYTHSPRQYLKNGFFFFYRKTDPGGRWIRKTSASRGFSANLLGYIVFVSFITIIITCIKYILNFERAQK